MRPAARHTSGYSVKRKAKSETRNYEGRYIVKTQSYLKSKWAGSASAAVIALAGCLTIGVSPASAQSNTVDDVIVVTGSIVRTKSQDFETPSPIQTVDQTIIKNTGAVKLQDLFKGLTCPLSPCYAQSKVAPCLATLHVGPFFCEREKKKKKQRKGERERRKEKERGDGSSGADGD